MNWSLKLKNCIVTFINEILICLLISSSEKNRQWNIRIAMNESVSVSAKFRFRQYQQNNSKINQIIWTKEIRYAAVTDKRGHTTISDNNKQIIGTIILWGFYKHDLKKLLGTYFDTLIPHCYWSWVQSRLKTIEGPRQNRNEGPNKTNLLVCKSIPLGIEWFLWLKNTYGAFFHLGALLKLSKIQFSDTLRNLGAPKNWGP